MCMCMNKMCVTSTCKAWLSKLRDLTVNLVSLVFLVAYRYMSSRLCLVFFYTMRFFFHVCLVLSECSDARFFISIPHSLPFGLLQCNTCICIKYRFNSRLYVYTMHHNPLHQFLRLVTQLSL